MNKQLRKNILIASYKAQAGHIPSAFCILEIVYTIYKQFLNEEDVFVLSKGHGCLALYAVFLEMGYITEEEFFSFCKYDSKLGGHPHRGKHEKIYASTGSLGHGLSICVGSALAKKLKNNSNKVFCLVGDGECNEGTIWESAMLADKLKLDNLICIVDDNNSQTRSMPCRNISKKFEAFGWRVIEVSDGHNIEELFVAFDQAINSVGRPTCIVCRTIKGKGIKEMEENMFSWHHGPPSAKQFNKFCEELDA
jgi:transketolase